MDEYWMYKISKDGENGLKKVFQRCLPSREQKNIGCMDSYIATICHQSKRFKKIEQL